VYVDGNPANVERGLQTLNIPPSGGAIVDMYFRDPGGKNPFVTHDFADASKGAVGVFAVSGGTSGATTVTATTSSAKSTTAGLTVRVNILQGAGSDMANNGYYPANIRVVIGVNNTVTWVNQDDSPHTVTAKDGKAFDSGALNPGGIWTYTFTQPGTYAYICSYHPWMQGTVTVVKSG
jgi:plastocyanin